MNTQQHDILRKHFGRVPEHYRLFPLPDEKRGGPEYACIGMTLENGEVFLFEFDFCVGTIPESEIDNLAVFGCRTCAEQNMSCPLVLEQQKGGCEMWGISSRAAKIAEAEYYKQLHEKHYGKISVSV